MPPKPNDHVGLLARVGEVAPHLAAGAASIAIGDFASGTLSFGQLLLKLGTASRSKAREQARLEEVDRRFDDLLRQRELDRGEAARRIAALEEELAWVRANLVDTNDEERYTYLRNSMLNMVVDDPGKEWAGLLARAVTELSPVEAKVLVLGWQQRQTPPHRTFEERGVGYTPVFEHSFYPLRVAEVLGEGHDDLAESAAFALLGRGLLTPPDDRAYHETFQFRFTALGESISALLHEPTGSDGDDPLTTG